MWTVVYSLQGLRTLTGKGRARALSPLGFYDSAGMIYSSIFQREHRGASTHSWDSLEPRLREEAETGGDKQQRAASGGLHLLW